jgi:hypothetical protein
VIRARDCSGQIIHRRFGDDAGIAPSVTLIQRRRRLVAGQLICCFARQLPRPPTQTKAVLGPKRANGPQTVTLGVLPKLFKEKVEPVLSPEGDRIVGRRQIDTGASPVIAGRGGDRIRQRDDETLETFEARVEAAAAA